ncbi:MAG: AsmA family protein, partial [Candidatus Omnitrophica bacterium]|nr:AsmA family protein [Candidatus Omnitrophota bacterium]
MKKILIVILALLVIVLAGAVIFLMTLDVDKYRPQIVKQVESMIHKPLTLEKISFGWHHGLALELQGLAVLKSDKDSKQLVKLGSAKAVLNLAPLLARQIQIATIFLDRPSVYLVKRPDGTIEGLEPAEKRPGEVNVRNAPAAAGEGAALSFLINEIQMTDGEVFFRDESGKQPLEVTFRDMDVTFKDVALNQPIDFRAKAAVLSQHQNFEATGKLIVSPFDGSGTIKNLHAELKLAPMDIQELIKVSPGLADAGIVPPLEGVLSVNVALLRLDEGGLKKMTADIRFDGGKVRLQALRSPVEEISAMALATLDGIQISKVSAKLAGGRVEGLANVNLSEPSNAVTSFDLKAVNLALENLLGAPVQGGPQLQGVLAASIKGTVFGRPTEQMPQPFGATVVVTIEQGVIKDMNILREIFQKLSMIPGVMTRLQERLPKGYQEKLKERDTRFDIIQIPFSVQNGAVQLPQVNLATDSFRIQGSGTYGLSQGTVRGSAVFGIEPDLSSAMVSSVTELQYLMSQTGELQIPLV